MLTVLPAKVGGVFTRLLGKRVTTWLSSWGDYLANTNHPLVQWFYLLVMWLDWYFLMFYGVFVYIPSNGMTILHSVAINMLFTMCLFIYFMACKTSPGRVTHENQK